MRCALLVSRLASRAGVLVLLGLLTLPCLLCASVATTVAPPWASAPRAAARSGYARQLKPLRMGERG